MRPLVLRCLSFAIAFAVAFSVGARHTAADRVDAGPAGLVMPAGDDCIPGDTDHKAAAGAVRLSRRLRVSANACGRLPRTDDRPPRGVILVAPKTSPPIERA